jgi:tripartite-type tricarboxylate transporter receptor subunit TctC
MRAAAFATSLLAAGLICGAPLAAAEYPERPIHIIVPLQPGSLSDNVARILAAKLGERLHQQVIVENRVGGSTVVGSEAVARAAPDGYTMEIINTSSHATVAAVMAKLPFDPVADFAPVGMIGVSPFVLVTSNKVPAASVAELIARAKRTPGTLTSHPPASDRSRTSPPNAGKAASIQLTRALSRAIAVGVRPHGRAHRPAGRTLSGSEPHIRAGKLRALAVMSAHRRAASRRADIAEASYPGSKWSCGRRLCRPARGRDRDEAEPGAA